MSRRRPASTVCPTHPRSRTSASAVRALFERLDAPDDLARAAYGQPARRPRRGTRRCRRDSQRIRRLADSIEPKPRKADRDRITRLMVILIVLIGAAHVARPSRLIGREAADDVDWIVRAAIAAAHEGRNDDAPRAVRRLRDVRMADAAEVGGKAASLGELIAAGARVPDGVVLTAAAAGMTADERGSLLARRRAGTWAADRSPSDRAASRRTARSAPSPACTRRCWTFGR